MKQTGTKYEKTFLEIKIMNLINFSHRLIYHYIALFEFYNLNSNGFFLDCYVTYA